jgi:hypothetical protein
MLIIKTPKRRQAERTYVLDTIFGDFLGLEWRAEVEDRTDTSITVNEGGAAVLIPDVLLGIADEFWLTSASMPVEPLSIWSAGAEFPEARLVSPEVPVIFRPQGKIDQQAGEIILPIDILGSCFFMLTRYEEVVRPVADQYDRFPGNASLAFRQGFLHRPIVNEYVEILWCALKRLWPQLQRKKRQSSSFVSCDVDEPYSLSSRSFPSLLRQVGGDVLKRGSFEAAARRIAGFAGHSLGHDSWDPANCFDWMMDVNEKAGNTMAFYFIADKTAPGLDGSAEIDDPFVIDLMSRIHSRGHEIGLHGSFNTYLAPNQLRKERDLLLAAVDRAGVKQSWLGGRQHFLRWRTPETARALNDIGLDYDTTLGFADMPGFRCGTCYPFRLFDLTTATALAIWERPLIVMEVSVIADQYLGLGNSEHALDLMNELKHTTIKFDGEFVLLWHNSSFLNGRSKSIYSQLTGV